MKKFRELSGKLVVAMLAVTLLVGCAIGGTVAWLTDKTDPVTNTFTYGDINIDLWETKDGMHTESRLNEKGYVVNARSDLKIIPGVDLPKDPTVTVRAGSEACWLFVKVEEANWPTFKETDGTTKKKKVSYAIATGWTALPGQDGVYYREVSTATTDSDSSFNILAGDTTYLNGVVKVSENLTKTEVNSITAGTQPKLTFTAYAVQKDGFDTAAAAWAEAGK